MLTTLNDCVTRVHVDQMFLAADARDEYNEYLDSLPTELVADAVDEELSYAEFPLKRIEALADRHGENVGQYLDRVAQLREELLADRWKPDCSPIGECD